MAVGVAVFRNRVDDEAPAGIYMVPEDAGYTVFRRTRLDSMEPARHDGGIEDAVQPVPGKRVHGKACVAPEVRQTDDFGAFQDGRVAVEAEALVEGKVEQDVPEAAPDVRHSPPTIAGERIQMFDDADGIILCGKRHAMPRVEGEKQAQQGPESNLGPVPCSPDDTLRRHLHA